MGSHDGHAEACGKILIRLRVGVVSDHGVGDDEATEERIARAIDEVVARSVPPGRETMFKLVAVSTITEPGDRAVARQVLDRGGELEVIAPRVDNDDEEYRRLLTRAARRSEIERRHGSPLDAPTAEHEIADRCDALITIARAEPATAPSRTGNVVSYARSRRVPVIHVTLDRADLDERRLENIGGGAFDKEAIDALVEYNDPGLERDWPLVVSTCRGHLSPKPDKPGAVPEDFLDWAAPYYTRADLIAERYRNYYWFVVRLLWILAAVSVIVAAVQFIWLRHHAEVVLIEIVALLLIIGLYQFGRHKRFRERWVSSRFIAERIRCGVYLAAAGVSPRHVRPRSEAPEDAWIRRVINEIWLLRPDPGEAGRAGVEHKTLIRETWVQQQRDYHCRRSRELTAVHDHLRLWTNALFFAALGAALAHFVIEAFLNSSWDRVSEVLVFVSISAPACGAAVHGYANQRDYRNHSERYARMEAQLGRLESELRQTKGDISVLRGLAIGVDRLMREECSDWFGAVRLQELEIP